MTVARFELDRRGIGAFLRSSGMSDELKPFAEREAAAMAGRTAVDTGETRDSTHIEPVMFRDRTGWMIIQEGAGVATHFGNDRTAPDHHGLPNGGG